MTFSVGLAKKIRITVLQMVHVANSSHVGSCFSMADILAVLYERILSYDSSNPQWEDRDRFILSKGHAAASIYAVLAAKNFFSEKLLDSYGVNGSNLMTHISHKIPGVEFSTGSLGHGLPFAVGKAMIAKKTNKKWKTYVVLGDGEMDEGSNWEALMFASHHKLDNLVAIIDYNKLQSLTSVEETLALEPLAKKIESFGACVKEINGHDHLVIEETLMNGWEAGKPLILIAHTTKGKGVSFMEDLVEWHYRSPNKEQMAIALKELGAE